VIVGPRVPQEACRLSPLEQEEPILSEREEAHVWEMMEYAEGHALEMEFNAIFSQSALVARLKYPPAEGIVGGGVPTRPKLKRNRKAAALQISESQSTEAAKPKSPILPLDKPLSEVKVERSSETFQEGIPEPLMEFVTQTSPKRQKRATEVPQKKVFETPKHTTVQPSPVKQIARP
jgi:hypothetical protein